MAIHTTWNRYIPFRYRCWKLRVRTFPYELLRSKSFVLLITAGPITFLFYNNGQNFFVLGSFDRAFKKSCPWFFCRGRILIPSYRYDIGILMFKIFDSDIMAIYGPFVNWTVGWTLVSFSKERPELFRHWCLNISWHMQYSFRITSQSKLALFKAHYFLIAPCTCYLWPIRLRARSTTTAKTAILRYCLLPLR